jgi:hypothetical protein
MPVDPQGPAALHLVTRAVLEAIRRCLEKLGIEFLVLKGPHLAYVVYPDPLQRIWSDLDLLVRPADFQRAFDALREDGFVPVPFPPGRNRTRGRYYQWPLRSPLGLAVELHRGLAGYGAHPVRADLLFQRAEMFSYDGLPLRGLCTEDLLLSLCIHAAKERFDLEEKHLTDLRHLLARRVPDWQRFLESAGRARCAAAAWFLLSAIRTDAPPPPVGLMDRLQPDLARRRAIALFLDPTSPPFPSGRVQRSAFLKGILGWLLIDGIAARFTVLFRYGTLRIADLAPAPVGPRKDP